MANDTLEVITCAVEPLRLIWITLLFLPATVLATFTTERNSPNTFQNRWFARFWNHFGPLSKQRNAPAIAPLLADASGVVLDIGTGAGHLLHLYDKSKVTKIVAVEMNREQHPGLLRSARAAGLQDRLEVAAVPVEQLASTGIKESFDSVVTLHMLCSADHPETIARAGYELLKPGGRWYVFEHVRAQSPSEVINLWQQALNLVWPFFLGGCQLTRDTARTLRSAGNWSGDTLQKRADDSPYAMIPDIQGVLIK